MNGTGCEWTWPWRNLSYYPAICLEWLRKAALNFREEDDLQAKILAQNLPNTKHEFYSTLTLTNASINQPSFQFDIYAIKVLWHDAWKPE
jgi:hypothetical protein